MQMAHFVLVFPVGFFIKFMGPKFKMPLFLARNQIARDYNYSVGMTPLSRYKCRDLHNPTFSLLHLSSFVWWWI